MRFFAILCVIVLVASQSCNVDIQSSYQVGDDVTITVTCPFVPSQFTVYPPLIGFDIHYPTITGKAVNPMAPTRYQIRLGHGDEVTTVVATLNIVKPFCRYGVGRVLHLKNEVYYRFKAPECNVEVKRIWAENLPAGLSINNNDGSIEGVVNEKTEKVARIFVNHEYNNQTFTFRTDFTTPFKNRLQLFYYDGDVAEGYSCAVGYTDYTVMQRFFNGYYDNENKRVGPFEENMPGDVFNLNIDGDEDYNYRGYKGYHGVFGFFRIDEEASYTFQSICDDCMHFYFYGTQPADRAISTRYWNEMKSSKSYYLYPGYYPIFMSLAFDGKPNGYKIYIKKNDGEFELMPLSKSFSCPEAHLIDKLTYPNVVRTLNDGENIQHPNDERPIFEGYGDKYSIKGYSKLTIDAKNGHHSGTVTECPRVVYGVIKAESGVSQSSVPIRYECGEVDNMVDKQIAVSLYKAESLAELKSFVDPSANPTYVKRLTKWTNSIKLDESYLTENDVVEWRGTIFGNGDKKIKVSCTGACYVKINAVILTVFGTESDKPEATAQLNGYSDILVVYYKTDESNSGFSLTFNDAEVTDSGDVYVAKKQDKEYMRTDITYADVKVGSSQSIKISHVGDQEPESYTIENQVKGLSISGSTITYSPTEIMTPISIVYIATLNGYEFRGSVTIGAHTVYEESHITYAETEFTGSLGDEVTITPTDKGNCAYIYTDTNLPSGLSLDAKTAVISGHYMEAITKDVKVICDTITHKTESVLSFTVSGCKGGGEIVHIRVTAGPDPSTFTNAMLMSETIADGKFADKENKEPFESFDFYRCIEGSAYLTVYSEEAIKGTYLVERGYGAFVKRGTYPSSISSIDIDLTTTGVPTPYYTESTKDDVKIQKTMTFYTNIQTTYFLKVEGSGAVTFSITPDLKIPGLTMDEYGTISGMATVPQEQVYTFRTLNHEEQSAEIQFSIVVKDCDLADVNVYFPFIGKSYEESTSKNDGFRVKSASNFLLYQDGTSTTKSNYRLCLAKGNYQLEMTSKNENGWVDSYIRLEVNKKEVFNAIYKPDGESTYSFNLQTYATEIPEYTLLYTDYVLDDNWKTAIQGSAVTSSVYSNKVGELNNHYTITRYYNYEFNVNSNTPIYRFTLHYEYGVAIYVNGIEIFREYLSAGNLTVSTPCSGEKKATDRTIDIPASILISGKKNILAVELHRDTIPSSDEIAKDSFAIKSVTEVNGLNGCYNLIMSDSYSRISDTSMESILDGAKYTIYSGEAKTNPLTITFKNLVSINDFMLLGTGANPPSTIAATARLGSTTKTLIKSKPVEFDDVKHMMTSIATEVNMPIDTMSITFVATGNMEIADFIPRYCIGFCPAETTADGDYWPAGRIGDTVEIPCKVGYTGSKTRVCGEGGSYGAVEGECTPSPQQPIFKYDKTEYTFIRTGTDVVIEAPKVTGVDGESVRFEIDPPFSEIFPNMNIDAKTGEISGYINPSYTTGEVPTTQPPTTQAPTTAEPTTQPPETEPPERRRNRFLAELVHTISQEFTVTAINTADENMKNSVKIKIIADDPKCDPAEGFPEAYVGETVTGIKCPIFMNGKVVRKCEFKDAQAYFGEDDLSVCEHTLIGACPFYGTGFVYNNVINRMYQNGWRYAVTETEGFECYDSKTKGNKIDCPEWLQLLNNGTLLAQGVSEEFTDFYVTFKIKNPVTDKFCNPQDSGANLARYQIKYGRKAELQQSFSYTVKEHNFTLSDNIDTEINPVQYLSGVDHCISDPPFPAGISFLPDYFNFAGRILVRPMGASAGTYKITCGNRDYKVEDTISINVNAPSCSNDEYGVLEIGGTKTLSCGKNKHGKIIVYCNNKHEFEVKENTCQDSKPTRLTYHNSKPVTFYQNVPSSPQRVDHDGDLGIAKFTTTCKISGLSVHPYLGYLVGTPTQLQNNLQTCMLSLSQDQTVNTTISYYIRQGSCTYMGQTIQPGNQYEEECKTGESGKVIKKCPSQPGANGGYNIVDASTCKKMKPVTFIYSTDALVLKVEREMTPLRPTVSSIAEFSVKPELPEGIELNPETGVISGTPKAEQDTKEYTFYAKDEWENPFKMTIRIVDKTCPQRDGFPETPIGSYGEIPCTNGNDGYERRLCNEDQSWAETIDDSECADAEPELTYPDKLYSFFVNVKIEPIVYLTSVGIVTYMADGLPEGLSMINGIISGTPTVESQRADYKITGITRKSEEIVTYISIAIEGSFCAENGGFGNTAAGETVYIPCTESTTWGVSSRKCIGPEESGKDVAEWEPAIECNKTEAPAGRKEFEFGLNLTNVNVEGISLERFNYVYEAVYELLETAFEKDISSLMYIANATSDNKLVYKFYIFTTGEEEEVKTIISQLIIQQALSPKLTDKDFIFFGTVGYEIDSEVKVTNMHQPPTDKEESELNLALIIGIAGGCVVLILIICVCIICCRMRSAKQSTFSREVPKAKKAARA